MILLKYLNEGLNFDSEYLKDNYKFTKLIGFTNIHNNQIFIYKNKLTLSKDNNKNKSKSYL